jgi:septal ring factor EnvC (AmiA/AmiB activator)
VKLEAVIAATPTFAVVTAACAALLLLTALFDRLRRQDNRSDVPGGAPKLPRSKRSAVTEMNGRLDQALAALHSQQQAIDELTAAVRSLQTQQEGRFSSLQQQLRELHTQHKLTLATVQAHQEREYERLQRIRAAIETHQHELQTFEMALGHPRDPHFAPAPEPSFRNAH